MSIICSCFEKCSSYAHKFTSKNTLRKQKHWLHRRVRLQYDQTQVQFVLLGKTKYMSAATFSSGIEDKF